MRRPDHIVLLVSSSALLDHELRRLGIPPRPFLRVGVTVVGRPRDAGGIMASWAVVPGHLTSEMDLANMHAATGQAEVPFHELIARQLAWRLWHDGH